MKISRLYLKILLAFIAVQITAVLIVGALVHSGKIRPPFTRYAEERTVSLKQMVSRELEGAATITPELRERLDAVLSIFARSFQGASWITDEQGVFLGKSFSGQPPLTGREAIDHSETNRNGDKLYLLQRQDDDGSEGESRSIYTVGTIDFNGTDLSVHLLSKWRKRKEELWLMKGLLLMGGLGALMLIPVSRRISRPLNELTKSAEHIARGDFSPRVDTNRNDEVGKLAQAFNHMVESLEKMIRGGRELTANLSHEIRSPLARIRLSQQILRDRLESGRTDGLEKHLDKMQAEIDHMDGLIDKILRLSKLDLQEPQTHDDQVDLNAMLHEALEIHQPLIQGKSLSLDMQSAALPPFRCRKEDFRMVLDNVLINAVKYSPEQATITLETFADDDFAFIRISNPYRLLTDAELESIFIPFKRLGYDPVEGNGLGLAFARKIVEEHGGQMIADSAGGVFIMTIQLPIDRQA